MTMTASNPTDQKDGRVVAIAGPVIDVEFPRGSLPELNTALEVTVGIIMLMSLVGILKRSKVPGSKAETVEMIGLYWHFVDVVWIIIFTLVYLIPA